MQCPNCEHQQADNATECARCGIIFARYQQHQQKLAQAAVAAARAGRRFRLGLGVALALLLALTAAGVFFLRPSPPEAPALPPQQAASATAPRPLDHRPASSPLPTPAASLQPGSGQPFGLAGQLAASFQPRNAIESARNATVYIKTPWGSGSGFFVTPTGYIITNRHVVRFDPDTLKKLEAQNDELARRLAEEQHSIDFYRQRLAGIGDPAVREEVAQQLRRRQEIYDKYNRLHQQVQSKLQEIEQASWVSDIKVVLIDGSEFPVQSLRMSDRADLALLSIDCINAPFIRPVADSLAEVQGQEVYTIGNPAGLRHTVTSGIVSGYRTLAGKLFIQTDAPINAGNSGGPLVDNDGRLIGVNTMILRNTEGIGFAIPYKTVREEFGLYLSSP